MASSDHELSPDDRAVLSMRADEFHVALTHGSWAAAAAANPLAYLAAGLATATAPVLVARAAGRGAAPRAWSAAARRRAHWAVAVVVALSWVFQLHRFGFL